MEVCTSWAWGGGVQGTGREAWLRAPAVSYSGRGCACEQTLVERRAGDVSSQPQLRKTKRQEAAGSENAFLSPAAVRGPGWVSLAAVHGAGWVFWIEYWGIQAALGEAARQSPDAPLPPVPPKSESPWSPIRADGGASPPRERALHQLRLA